MNWFAHISLVSRWLYRIGKIRLFQSSQAIEIKSFQPSCAITLGKEGSRNGFDLATAHENTGLSIANLRLDNQQFFWCFVGILLQHWGAECIRNDSNATSFLFFSTSPPKNLFSLGYRLAQSHHYGWRKEFVEVTTLCCLFSNRLTTSLLAAVAPGQNREPLCTGTH